MVFISFFIDDIVEYILFNMILTSHIEPRPSKDLYTYLKSEFLLSDSAIKLAIKQSQNESAPIHIILWNFGLISIPQYHKLLGIIHQYY